MQVKIEKSQPKGCVMAPISKSILHRLLIASSLSNGKCIIDNAALNDDITATVDCLKKLGTDIEFDYEKHRFTVVGFNPFNRNEAILNCNESASTLRFLIPVSALSDKYCLFTGSKRLFERSMTVYEDLGLIDRTASEIALIECIKADDYIINGNISSQFISGMLFALPLLETDSKITVTQPFESKGYVDMTIEVLKLFGVEIVKCDNIFYIKGGQKYHPTDTVCDYDMSGIAYFEALNTIYGGIDVIGKPKSKHQSDGVLYEYFDKIKSGVPVLSVADCPDLAPILTVLASYYNGCTLIDTKRLSIKESNRGSAMKAEIEKCGGKVIVNENSITVKKALLKAPSEPLDSHNDHRVAMAMSVLLTAVGGTVDGAECVNKSMPDYFEKLEKLNVKLTKV